MRVPKPAKHGRDHCPGGEDPIPCFSNSWIRRRLTTGRVSCSSGNQTNITPYDDVVGATDYETQFSTPTAHQIKVLNSGIYIVSVQMLWSSFDGDRILVLNDGFSWSAGFLFSRATGWETSMHTFTLMHRYPANQTINLSMQQSSGSAQTVGPGYFEVMRIGSYTGPDPSSAEE